MNQNNYHNIYKIIKSVHSEFELEVLSERGMLNKSRCRGLDPEEFMDLKDMGNRDYNPHLRK